MKFIKRIALSRPYFHLTGYMNRYWLLGGSHMDQRPTVPWRRFWLDKVIGKFIAIRIHHILRSDNDWALHDHPWPALSIILTTGYTEVMPVDQHQAPYRDYEPDGLIHKKRRRGAIVFRKAHHRHRLIIPEGKTAWTLFFMFGKRNWWGFYTRTGKVYYRDYLSAKEVGDA